jgi:hypothetical protein
MQYGSVRAFLERHSKLVITAHETPDADALGAEFAMQRALLKLGTSSFICNADPAPDNLSFVEPLHRPLVRLAAAAAGAAEHALLILDVNDGTTWVTSAVWSRPGAEYFIITTTTATPDLSRLTTSSRRPPAKSCKFSGKGRGAGLVHGPGAVHGHAPTPAASSTRKTTA